MSWPNKIFSPNLLGTSPCYLMFQCRFADFPVGHQGPQSHNSQHTGDRGTHTRNGFTAWSHRKSSVQTSISDPSNILPLRQPATWNSPHFSCTDHRYHLPHTLTQEKNSVIFQKSSRSTSAGLFLEGSKPNKPGGTVWTEFAPFHISF